MKLSIGVNDNLLPDNPFGSNDDMAFFTIKKLRNFRVHPKADLDPDHVSRVTKDFPINIITYTRICARFFYMRKSKIKASLKQFHYLPFQKINK